MSVGHFDYNQYRMEDIARSIDEIIENNDDFETNDWGEKIGYGFPDNIIEKFKETSYNLRRVAEMVQRVDYLVSGDDGEESFLKRWNEEVRKKYEI